jgi:replication initiation protein RepC
MMEHIATTPFGGGRMTARLFQRQRETAKQQEKLRADTSGNNNGRADKWQLMRAVTEARQVYGLGDRTISVLEALVSFAPARELDGSQPIIVFPSNRELSVRARGMAPATIRRHLVALVEAGMIFRRDSANGKRYCRRNKQGLPEEAFGFDLAPLALRAQEIHQAAEIARVEDRAIRALRSEVTVHHRDIAKLIACALEEERAGNWHAFTEQLVDLTAGLGRRMAPDALAERRNSLLHLRIEVENAYFSSISQEEMSANDLQNEQHIQDSDTDKFIESNCEVVSAKAAHEPKQKPSDEKTMISLERVMRVCPQIADYTKQGIRNWADLLTAADLVRSVLGVSPDAWHRTRAVMGEQGAAVVIAAMLERGETIRSPGAYLRDLTDKANRAEFTVYPMLQALERGGTAARAA